MCNAHALRHFLMQKLYLAYFANKYGYSLPIPPIVFNDELDPEPMDKFFIGMLRELSISAGWEFNDYVFEMDEFTIAEDGYSLDMPYSSLYDEYENPLLECFIDINSDISPDICLVFFTLIEDMVCNYGLFDCQINGYAMSRTFHIPYDRMCSIISGISQFAGGRFEYTSEFIFEVCPCNETDSTVTLYMLEQQFVSCSEEITSSVSAGFDMSHFDLLADIIFLKD